MEIYLLKSAVSLSILYTFYWLLLRNETYFKWNRVYLISSIIISLTSPLINISFFEKAGASINNVIQPVIISTQNNIIRENHSLSILSIIYISGAVFFTLKFLSKLSQIFYMYNRFQKVQYNGFRAVLVDSNISPFTFFSLLFLSRSDYEKGNITEIVVHEINPTVHCNTYRKTHNPPANPSFAVTIAIFPTHLIILEGLFFYYVF